MDEVANLFPISFGNTGLESLPLDRMGSILEWFFIEGGVDLSSQCLVHNFPQRLILSPGAPFDSLEKIIGDFNRGLHMGNHITVYGCQSKAPTMDMDGLGTSAAAEVRPYEIRAKNRPITAGIQS